MKLFRIGVLLPALGCICAMTSPALSAQTTTTHKTVQRRHMSTTGSLLNPASLHATAPAVYHVHFHTTKGDFTIEVT
ncbi:MAG: hypothetical protein WA876_08385, partial [Candidatus Acidiferrales bacterium]